MGFLFLVWVCTSNSLVNTAGLVYTKVVLYHISSLNFNDMRMRNSDTVISIWSPYEIYVIFKGHIWCLHSELYRISHSVGYNICIYDIVLCCEGEGVSRCIEDPLMAFGCCLLYGRVVVPLTHCPFQFWILSNYVSF